MTVHSWLWSSDAQRSHCHSWTTAGADLQLGSEHKLSSPLLRLQGKCSTFFHCHLYVFSLCSLLDLDVTWTGFQVSYWQKFKCNWTNYLFFRSSSSSFPRCTPPQVSHSGRVTSRGLSVYWKDRARVSTHLSRQTWWAILPGDNYFCP